MDILFQEVAAHTALARSIEQLGTARFWRQLVLVLRHWVPFDNALIIHFPAQGAPQVLEEYDAAPAPAAGELYLDGLYLLDPFYQAAREGLASGLYHLEEVAPDSFWQADYYLNYFQAHVLQDEVQFLLQLPEGVLSVSLGMRRSFSAVELGKLRLVSGWVLALLGQHWARSDIALPAPAPMGDALARFGQGVLSERELEIARLILRGYSSKAMAQRLGISPETIKAHRRHLYAKLNISSQPELFSVFIRELGFSDERPMA
ncbi:LuxR C-terminal-related transcriptional regulator [Pseudomonas sp. DTU_2021_1001937_2_SI_NGA_ILE_001]|uniref:helix-turn-helix transcriptional regulator n=1 Tax=Pseudomonas sp. DTU_2021_1001937_2_SI_NGA_ILE_001 TaxID=3077589 RepID=UPI0028FC1F5B|nr:LuxR C-terminal-related transcriptional regulator [Pseudomonas sp. DTU_2021_1001937_2_SI_NGA_ILE_001]WNW10304.1 LuxR C-terminal-related transcriptional regulator [Pseudomonas sp. DTU_2021_1001937_2_SI_NGA_ILE_001]